MAGLNDAQLLRAMNMLEVRPEDFRHIEAATSLDECQQRFTTLKERVRKRFRQLATQLHPDKTNNDPVKTEDFKLVAAAVDELDKLRVGRIPAPRPQPQYQQVTIRVSFVRREAGFSSTSTTTTTGWYGGF